jgi:hypothetical protein
MARRDNLLCFEPLLQQRAAQAAGGIGRLCDPGG